MILNLLIISLFWSVGLLLNLWDIARNVPTFDIFTSELLQERVIMAAACGLMGGLSVGWGLKQRVPSLSGIQVIIIGFMWAIALAIGVQLSAYINEYDIAFNQFHLTSFTLGSIRQLINFTIAGLIGGCFMGVVAKKIQPEISIFKLLLISGCWWISFILATGIIFIIPWSGGSGILRSFLAGLSIAMLGAGIMFLQVKSFPFEEISS
ncbi:hypothetical protein PCC9214_02470 [Planktothrix tepida]|uniref:Uncharacterized protein n=1 Tax=Planktothrix tepida PCC 9214 TaxID=671072 RepID=A0A1J1LKE6_9CYAN|nr:hypothetical protein [Planktothrix tepida]CAD5949663.1 hypothetical protein PCC9214_02470 [Planktothrix tepida]CUR32514.1 membrane hypothetical protein [Planktothrix tepida PCC 9214]